MDSGPLVISKTVFPGICAQHPKPDSEAIMAALVMTEPPRPSDVSSTTPKPAPSLSYHQYKPVPPLPSCFYPYKSPDLMNPFQSPP